MRPFTVASRRSVSPPMARRPEMVITAMPDSNWLASTDIVRSYNGGRAKGHRGLASHPVEKPARSVLLLAGGAPEGDSRIVRVFGGAYWRAAAPAGLSGPPIDP